MFSAKGSAEFPLDNRGEAAAGSDDLVLPRPRPCPQ